MPAIVSRAPWLRSVAWLRWLGLAAGMVLAGCLSTEAPTTNVGRGGMMPPHTVLLSTMMGDLAAEPGFSEKMIAALGGQSKTGAAVFPPNLLDKMRETIRGKWWWVLDKFPGWPMADINPMIDLSGDLDKSMGGVAALPLSDYIDLGEYGLERAGTVDLDQPSTLPEFSTQGLVQPLGDEVVRGDGANPALAPMHSESLRLAQVLNRLALNGPAHSDSDETGEDPVEGNIASTSGTTGAQAGLQVGRMTAVLGGRTAATPEELVSALQATGHEVTVADARYFANFGHLHYEGMDVMMPFWVNAGVLVPGTNDFLKVPVSHAELEWRVRGPKINADVAFYFGIDGKAEFRTMDQLDQAWVMGRHAHEYRGTDAVEATRLTGLLALAYAHAHLDHPKLPFGGYYALGVCQDGVAAVEQKMTGKTTLFPNTADMSLFKDERDAEINGLLAQVPKDHGERKPEMERVFGSLPTTDLAAITIPGLADDLIPVQKAWHSGTLRSERRPKGQIPALILALVLVGLLSWLGWRAYARRRYGPRARRYRESRRRGLL